MTMKCSDYPWRLTSAGMIRINVYHVGQKNPDHPVAHVVSTNRTRLPQDAAAITMAPELLELTERVAELPCRCITVPPIGEPMLPECESCHAKRLINRTRHWRRIAKYRV